MAIPSGTTHGTPIRWIGEPHDELGQAISPGDVGTFLDFDGPPSVPDAVVIFNTMTFVASREDIEVVQK